MFPRLMKLFQSSDDIQPQAATELQLQQKAKAKAQQDHKNLMQTVVYGTLASFVQYFVNYHVSFDNSRDLLMQYCKVYDLDQQRTHILLSELEALQKQNYRMTKQDRLGIVEKRRAKQSKYGQFLMVALVVAYVGEDQVLGRLLRMSKGGYQALKVRVWRQALLGSQPDRLPQKRIALWTNILSLESNTISYQAFKTKVLDQPKLIENVEEVINLDVQRSAESMPGLDMDQLLNILKTYALYNPEIEYSQGMNYVAGFLLSVFKNEEVAFKALIQIADRSHFAQLFN